MNLRMIQLRRTAPRDLMKLDEMKLIYSTRDEKIQLLKKFSRNRIRSCEKSIARKKVKISIQIPRFETEIDEEEKSVSPDRSSAFNTMKFKRVTFKSNLEKVYGCSPRLLTPYKKLSYGIF